MRILLDTNILIRAFISERGSARRLLLAILSSENVLNVSSELLQELTRVLRQPRLIALHGKTEEDVYEFASWIASVAEVVLINPLLNVSVRDPKDVFVLQTAISGGANVVCSLDRDLYEPPASDVLRTFRIKVLSDLELLQRVRQ